jgi:peptide/nickel transport system substrate-binding protein
MIAITAMLAAAAPAVAGQTNAASVEAGQGGRLRLVHWQFPSTINSYLAQGTSDLLAGSLVLEPLAEVAPDGSVVPALAAEVPTEGNGGISADLTEITWTLQEGVLWSDGSAMTADDVVFSWEYCSNPLTPCSGADNFSNVLSVVAVDESTVTVTFDGPTPYPYRPFVGFTSPIIQREQFEDCVGAAAAGCTDDNVMPVGTGPFKVTKFKADQKVQFKKNSNYRNISEGQPFFGSVVIRPSSGPESAARKVLKKNRVDFAWNLQLPAEILGPLVESGKGTVATAFTSNVEHINLNQTNPEGTPPSGYAGGTNPNPYFFENTVLHDALSMAVDRTEIVTTAYGFLGKPTCNIWTVGAQTSTNNDACLTQDIAGANALLDANGYLDTDGDGVRETPDGLPLEFDLVTSTNAVRQAVQDLLEGYWGEIGVAVNMRNEPPELFFSPFSDVGIWQFLTDMQMFTNGAASPDAADYLSGWTIPAIPDPVTNPVGGNIPRLASAQYDALHAQLAATPLDDPARDGLVIQLNDIIVDYSTIPLVLRGSASAFGERIDGHGELNGWDSEYWKIELWTRVPGKK